MAADEVEARTMAVMSKIEAQAITVSPFGHRPPGTHVAVAAIAAEAAQLRASGTEELCLSVEEVLAQVPEGVMEPIAKDRLRERLEAEQFAKRLRST